MNVNYKDWTNSMVEFCNINSKMFQISKSAPIGYRGEYPSFKILMSSNIYQYEIVQSGAKENDVIALNHLKSTIELSLKTPICLSINSLELIEKLFLWKRFRTGNEPFDKKFIIRTNASDIATQLFTNPGIQNFFLKNQFIVFNMSSDNNKTTIVLKDMRQIIFSHEFLLTFIETFETILKIVALHSGATNSKKTFI
jgi:hypothetical protein